MTTGRGRARDPAPRRPRRDRRDRPGQRGLGRPGRPHDRQLGCADDSRAARGDHGQPGGTAPEFPDLAALQQTDVVLESLADGCGRPAAKISGASSDPVVDLLAALVADVQRDLPAGSWLASPWLAPQARRRAERTGRRMRAVIAVGVAAATFTIAITLVSTTGAGLPGPLSAFGSPARQAAGAHQRPGSASRPGTASRQVKTGRGSLAMLPGILLVPVSPPGAAAGALARHRR